MNLLSNTRAQAGGIITFIISVFFLGFFYVAFSYMMGRIQDVNNQQIANTAMPYSTQHYNSINYLFQWWWAVPIIFIILLVIYALRNALSKAAGIT